MKVWTRQDSRILNELETNGVYRCKKEYIDNKMEDFSSYYRKLYTWYAKRAETIVPKPIESIEYPIWVSIDEKMQLREVPGTVILELEVNLDEIIITDLEKWGYVVNFFYLPKDRADLSDHYAELEKYAIGDEAELIMGNKGNFYPLLKKKIVDSWERLFDDYTLSEVRQGTLWEIRKESIISIVKGGKRDEL